MTSKMIRRTEPSEHQIISGVMDFARSIYVPISPAFYSESEILEVRKLPLIRFFVKINNEGKRSFSHTNYLKKEGFNKGVSDSFLSYPIASDNKMGLWMEAKTKKGKLTEDQNRWLTLMRCVGFNTVVYRSVDEGIQAIKDYLGMR